MLRILNAYLKIVITNGLLIKVPNLEPSATLERLGLNNFLDLGRSVGETWDPSLLSEGTTSESSFAS